MVLVQFGAPTFKFFFMGLLRVLEETKKERWPPPSLFFSFGGVMVFFICFFSLMVWLLGPLNNGMVYLGARNTVESAHGNDHIREARLHCLAAILPVEGHLLPVLCRCGLCGASSVLCIPASPLARKTAVTDGLVLAHARQVGLVTLVLAPVARLALDEPEASHVNPVLLAQLFGHCEGGLGRGHLCGVHGARGERRWGGRRWAEYLAVPDKWGAQPFNFFLRAPLANLLHARGRATDIKKEAKRGGARPRSPFG